MALSMPLHDIATRAVSSGVQLHESPAVLAPLA